MEQKEIVQSVIDYIEETLNENTGAGIALDQIAGKMGYSKFYLNRIFQERIGTTIHQYIMERRLTEAAKKLVYTDRSLCDIAYEAGYQSQQAFTNAFSRIYQQTPLNYRIGKVWSPLRRPYAAAQLYAFRSVIQWEMIA